MKLFLFLLLMWGVATEVENASLRTRLSLAAGMARMPR